MKKLLIISMLFMCSMAIGQSKQYTLGLNPDLGGYVFFLEADKKHGLVAETQDQSSLCVWYEAQDVISNWNNHSTNGKKFIDWRLPTKHELNLMYSVKALIGGFKTFISTKDDHRSIYWSSTENDDPKYDFYVWKQNFYDGFQSDQQKNNTYSVRAIRSF